MAMHTSVIKRLAFMHLKFARVSEPLILSSIMSKKTLQSFRKLSIESVSLFIFNFFENDSANSDNALSLKLILLFKV